MIELGLSDKYLEGYNARLKNIPYNKDQSDDWRMGWKNANHALKRS